MAISKVRKDVTDKVDDRYYIQLHNPGGGKYKRVIRGKRIAERHEAEMKIKLAGGGIATSGERLVTVRELMASIFEAKATLSENTLRAYRGALKNHIDPAIGGMRVAKLVNSSLVLTGLFERIERESGREARRQSESLVRYMLKLAVREGLIDRNPLDGVPWPKRISVRGAVYAPEMADVLRVRKDVLENKRVPWGTQQMVAAQLDVLIGSGVRAGELMGISEDDVDWERKTIAIRRQVIYVPRNPDETGDVNEDALKRPAQMIFAPPKTDDSGHRVIPVPQFVLSALAASKLRNGTREITLPWERPDGKPQTHRLFFFSLRHGRDNQPCAPLNVTNRMSRIGKRLGLDGDLHAHGYRHRYTTILHDGGVPQIVIDYITGHLPAGSVTLTVYTKATRAGLDKARKVIEQAWVEATEDQARKAG